jgi:hypothetical protein
MFTRLWLLGNRSQMKLIVEQKKQHMVTVARCHYTPSMMSKEELTQDLEHSAACHRSAAFGGLLASCTEDGR